MTIIDEEASEEQKQLFFAGLPPHMYKYRSWKDEYHRRILTHNELFFSSPRNFNDPYDCGMPLIQNPNNADPATIIVKVEKLAKKMFPHLIDQPDKLKEECAKQVLLIMQDPLTWFEMNWGMKKHDLAATFGIVSLTEFYNKELLWSHYGDSHRGFCVEFATRSLFEGARGSYSKVIYENEIPVISILDDMEDVMHKLLYTKSTEWEYEQEHRIIKIHHPDTRQEYPPDCLTGIYFGVNMPLEHQLEIIEIATGKYPNVTFYTMHLNKQRFEFLRGNLPLFKIV